MSTPPNREFAGGESVLDAFGFDDPRGTWLDHVRAVESAGPLGCIGQFEIVDEISRGGQGVVYRAKRPGFEREVAVKRLAGGAYASEKARKALEREVQLAAQLSHPNIVSVFGLEVVDGQPLLAMQWVDGASFDEWAKRVRSQPDGISRILDVFVKVCLAVHYAHQRGVIHRDLKPANVLVDEHGEPQVLDFGLACELDSPSQTVTGGDAFAGTPAYASPEQFRVDTSPADVRSDVYSMGVMLFEALTGSLPYEPSSSPQEIVDWISRGLVIPSQGRAAAIPADLESILKKAIAIDPDDRYQSVHALALDIRRFLANETVLAHPQSVFYSAKKFYRRRRLAVTLGAALLFVAATGTVAVTLLARSTMQANERQARALKIAKKAGNFLEDVLSSADPHRRGGDVTVVQVLEEAADRVENELGDEPLAAAEICSTIARTYYNLWLTKRSEPHWRSALAYYRRAYDGDRAEIADTLQALGAVLTFQDRPEAISLLREAVAMNTRLFGAHDQRTIRAMHSLGFATYRTTQPPDYATAEKIFRDVLGAKRELYGQQHPTAATTMHAYAAMLSRQGRHEESLSQFREALDLLAAYVPKDNPTYLECLSDYARALARAGRCDESRTEMQIVLENTGAQFGETWTANPLAQLADVELRAGNYDEAVRLNREALTVYARGLLTASYDASATVRNGLRKYLDNVETNPALAMPLEVARSLRDVPSDRHVSGPLYALILHQLARSMHLANGAQAAIPLAREAVYRLEQEHGADHWRTAEGDAALGTMLMEFGALDEAEALLAASHATLVRWKGVGASETTVAALSLATLYEATGRAAEAARLRAPGANLQIPVQTGAERN